MRIGILGPFGLGNLGDAAIQDSVIAAVHRLRPDATLVGISMSPRDTATRHGIEAHPIGRMAVGGWSGGDRRSLAILNRLRRSQHRALRLLARFTVGPIDEIGGIFKAVRIARDLDLLMISGGDQLADYRGGPWRHPYSLLVWTVVSRLAGTPVAFVSLGAGQLDAIASRIMIRAALMLSRYRSYRDLPSKGYVADATGFRRDDPVFPDLAFSLPVAAHHAVGRDVNQGRRTVAIGPRSHFDRRAGPEYDAGTYKSYIGHLAQVAASLVERGYRVELFPGEAVFDAPSIGETEAATLRLLPDALHEHVAVPRITGVDELLACLSRADYVIASRFHGALLAQLVGTPTLALAYHGEVSRLMRDSGVGEYCLDIQEKGTAEVLATFSRLESRREEVQARLAEYRAVCRTLLDRQYRDVLSIIRDEPARPAAVARW